MAICPGLSHEIPLKFVVGHEDLLMTPTIKCSRLTESLAATSQVSHEKQSYDDIWDPQSKVRASGCRRKSLLFHPVTAQLLRISASEELSLTL